MYLPGHMYVYALPECLVLREPEEAVGSPKTGVIDSCKPACESWVIKLCPLQEHTNAVNH